MRSVWLHKLALIAVSYLGKPSVRLLGRTMHLRVHGGDLLDEAYRDSRSVIFAFWHGDQLMMPLMYRGRPTYVLISRHRDGELIDRVVRAFGGNSVRGSTTRGGRPALRRLIEFGRAGADLVVTPDGPKGPRHVAKPGAVQLAKATGMPIVPIAFACSKKKS